MKTLFLMGAALAAVTITPASAQLLGGGGGLTGGLGGSLSGGLGGNVGGTFDRSVAPTIDRVRDRADTSVRSARRGSGEVIAERRVDRRSGRVRAGGSARGDGASDGSVQALGGVLGGSGNGSGSASGSADAQLIGTDAVRSTVGSARDRVQNGVATTRDRVQGIAGAARDRAQGAVGAVQGGAGSLNGAASGSGTGSVRGGSASGSGEGALSLMGSGAIPALNPGSMVHDAKGEAIGRVQSVRRNAAGKVEAVTMAVGRRTATLPADNFGVQGDVLVSAMGEGQVQRAAKDQAAE
ncbi:hypothetical protein [Sphingomonas sp. Leaf10]|uniref:hypothetical protein n=1 Tax=Sphingomonas sp. Leaf10 TaxID=1735676 RepID=UPI0006F7349F|nr:hypothetical protein [Sphingomonas sp. Leaf10]KQM36596.1 hypothetical protein ASE59_14955 [Sphingomonas sp. Leaf10]